MILLAVLLLIVVLALALVVGACSVWILGEIAALALAWLGTQIFTFVTAFLRESRADGR